MLASLALLSTVSVPAPPPGGEEPARVERVAELEPSSFLPSWVRGSGMPRLLYVVGEPGGEAALMLGSPLGRAPVELASGSGWFLNWADFPAAGLNGTTRVVSWLELTPDAPHSYGTRFQVDEASTVRPIEDHDGPGEHGFVSFAPHGDGFMALWLDGRAAAPEDGDVAVVGDAEFLANRYLGNGSNLEIGVNLVNWLSHDDGLIAISPRPAPDTRLELLPWQQLAIAIFFLILLPLSLLGSGLRIWLKRRKL